VFFFSFFLAHWHAGDTMGRNLSIYRFYGEDKRSGVCCDLHGFMMK